MEVLTRKDYVQQVKFLPKAIELFFLIPHKLKESEGQYSRLKPNNFGLSGFKGLSSFENCGKQERFFPRDQNSM